MGNRTALAAIVLTASLVRPVSAGKLDGKIQAQQAKIHSTHQQLEHKRSELHTAAQRVGALHEQLATTTHNIARVNARLDVLVANVHQTQKKLAWNRVQLSAAKATVARHDAALRRRVVDTYEHGDMGYIDVLLQARTFGDFVERWNDVRYIITANETTLRARRAAQAKVASVEHRLTAEEARLGVAFSAEQQQRRELAGLALQRKNLLVAAEGEQHAVATQVAALDEATQSERASLEDLIREKQAEEEAARRAAAEAARRAAMLSGQTLPAAPALGSPGAIGWPVSGSITDPYGMRTNPVTHQYAMHTGIDIGAAMGTTIVAPAGGKVLIAGWNDGGYGNMIVLDHGGSMSTLFGHCSQIFVSAGQTVERGQAIGAVGSTGRSTGPHLHFEVLVNGHPADPMSYLR